MAMCGSAHNRSDFSQSAVVPRYCLFIAQATAIDLDAPRSDYSRNTIFRGMMHLCVFGDLTSSCIFFVPVKFHFRYEQFVLLHRPNHATLVTWEGKDEDLAEQGDLL